MQVYCELSNISIDYDTECLVFILKLNKWDNRIFDLAAFPISGRYDDWQRININREEVDSQNLKLIESYFNCDLYDLLDVICGNRSIKDCPDIANAEEISKLRLMYVRKDVYDYLSKEKLNGEPYTGSMDHFDRILDIIEAIRLFCITETEVSLYEYYTHNLKRGVTDSCVKDYSFEYFVKEYGLIANYMLLFKNFEKQLRELRILHVNMKYLSKTWTPYTTCITHQFQEHKIHKKTLREFSRIMTKSLKEDYD
jgi:hypothetical protein